MTTNIYNADTKYIENAKYIANTKIAGTKEVGANGF